MQRRIFLTALGLGAGLPGVAQDVIKLRVPAPDEAGAKQVFAYEGVPAPPAAGMSTFQFVRSEFGPGEAVRNAPYTAEATTETVQVLADGNRITQKDTTVLARDSDGRTRRDVTLPLLPGMSAGDAPRFSFVFDAATNTSWTLDHNAKTVRKAQGRAFIAQASNKAFVRGATGAISTFPAGAAPVRVQRQVNLDMALPQPAQDASAKTESLGRQTIEGVVADGTRTTTVIPAGQIGNERPIDIVSERWYSPDLQIVVRSKHVDPRSGETTYQLTNVKKGEPPKSMFEIPADYTAQTGEDTIRSLHVGPGKE